MVKKKLQGPIGNNTRTMTRLTVWQITSEKARKIEEVEST